MFIFFEVSETSDEIDFNTIVDEMRVIQKTKFREEQKFVDVIV